VEKFNGMVRSAAPTSLIGGGGGLLEEHKIGKKEMSETFCAISTRLRSGRSSV
jgi:hypothetical protein